MITREGGEIRFTDRYRSKFGSALAEYVYCCLIAGGWDTVASIGDADWGESFDRVGPRHILHSDDRGFVDLYRYPTEDECDAVWDEIDAAYSDWLSDDEEVGR